MSSTRSSSNLRSGFAWLVTGNALYSICQWGIIWVLARLGTPEQVGQYALGMAIASPILLFGNCQLRAVVASDVKEEHPLGQYLSFRLATLALAVLAIAAIAAPLPVDATTTYAIVLAGVVQAIEFTSDTYYGVMQREDRYDRIGTSLLLKGPLALGALTVVMYTTGSVVYALLGLAAGRLAILLLWDARLSTIRRDFAQALSWDWKRVRSLLRMALPLGVISMLVSANAGIPRYFLEAHAGTAVLGVFAAIASLLSAGTMLVSSMGQSLFVPVAQACATGDIGRYRTHVRHALTLGGIVGGVAVLAAVLGGARILGFLFGPEYRAHSGLFVMLMIAGAVSFIASGLGYVMTAARSLRPQIPLMAASAGTGAVASMWLVPLYGPQGAAVALTMAALVQLAGTIGIVVRIDRKVRASHSSSLVWARAAGQGDAYC